MDNVVFERFRMLADQQKKFESIPTSDFGDMASQSFASKSHNGGGVSIFFSPPCISRELLLRC